MMKTGWRSQLISQVDVLTVEMAEVQGQHMLGVKRKDEFGGQAEMVLTVARAKWLRRQLGRFLDAVAEKRLQKIAACIREG